MELRSAIETIPVTSADAERGFSAMNNISSPLRNRLGVDRLHVANVIFVSPIGSPISEFNALPYARKWLASGHHGTFETTSKKLQQKTSDRYSHICKVSGRGIKCPGERIVNSLNEHRSICFSTYKDLPKS